MYDKTSLNLQPSTSFDELSTARSSGLLTSTTAYQSPSIPKFLPTINSIVNMERDIGTVQTVNANTHSGKGTNSLFGLHKENGAIHISPLDKSSSSHSKMNQDNLRIAMLSPPEQVPRDNFNHTTPGPASMAFTPMVSMRQSAQAPLSPPISPQTKTDCPDDSPSPHPSTTIRDPILYPQSDIPSPREAPLFSDTHRVVDEHVAARESSAFREVSPPRDSEYQLALEFKSQVAQAFNANRRLWAQREFAQLREDNALKAGGRRYTTIAPAAAGSRAARQGPKPTRPNTGKVAKTPRPPKPAVPRGMTPDSGKRVAREDKDFSSLPDFCPPLDSLPNKANSLKVDWKGAPIDLRFDPHAHLLHPDEISLAANLRLDCATYLTSKRRIFIKRIEAYRINKEFRKTDAQQACKIDVNKASKLWQAFDKVGWLNAKWIARYV
jgi:hypothetical protein